MTICLFGQWYSGYPRDAIATACINERARGHDRKRVRTASAVRSINHIHELPRPDGVEVPKRIEKNERGGGADALLRFLRVPLGFAVFFLAGRATLRLFFIFPLLRAAMLLLALDLPLDFDFRFLDLAINKLPECLR